MRPLLYGLPLSALLWLAAPVKAQQNVPTWDPDADGDNNGLTGYSATSCEYGHFGKSAILESTLDGHWVEWLRLLKR